MPHTLKLSVVIPAYNEEKNIGPTVAEVQKAVRAEGLPYEIIVVNDNSRDGTPAVIRELMAGDPSVRTVDRTPPGGFGRAIRSGLDAVSGDVVVIYMADLSDSPSDLVAYYRKIEEGYDCVFGSRFIPGAEVKNYPLVKRLVNRAVNKMIQLLFWTGHNDLTNAFKAYRTEVIRECGPYRSSHFNITIEMSLSAVIRNYNIAELPIRWYGRTWGASNLRLTQMGRRYLVVLLRMFFERILIRDDLVAEKLAAQARGRRDLDELRRRVETLEKAFPPGAEKPPSP